MVAVCRHRVLFATMRVEDLPTRPERAELVITPTLETRGLDLLGLRAPAESVAVSLMNGVTTISPLVRYLGLRAWTIHRYAVLGGLNSSDDLRRFAGKVEAAVAYSNELREAPASGAVGGRFASKNLQTADGLLPLRPLTQNLALDAYAGPSQDLGISWRRRPVAGLSKERGVALAEAVAQTLSHAPVLSAIDLAADEQPASLTDLALLRDVFPLDQPAEPERRLLIDAILPREPRVNELSRVATYALLLWLARRDGARIEETTLFETARDANPDVPACLHPTCDGWLRFLVRDCLVATHEKAVSDVLAVLRSEVGIGFMRKERALERIVATTWSSSLQAVGLPDLDGETPIKELCRVIEDVCGPATEQGGIGRWDTPPDELSIIATTLNSADPGASACLLPVAWVVAERRLRAGLAANTPDIDLQGGPALARIGVREVILPAVTSWRSSSQSIRVVIAELVARSVDQHLRIAWSRLQADPRRDVAVVVSDGTEWMAQADLNAWRATSRVYQAVNWLGQLGLVDEEGTTDEGDAALDRAISVLETRDVAR